MTESVVCSKPTQRAPRCSAFGARSRSAASALSDSSCVPNKAYGAQRIVADLEEGGYLSRSREGRRNRYEVHLDRPLRHAVESHREVRVLLDLILRPDQPDPGDPEN